MANFGLITTYDQCVYSLYIGMVMIYRRSYPHLSPALSMYKQVIYLLMGGIISIGHVPQEGRFLFFLFLSSSFFK